MNHLANSTVVVPFDFSDHSINAIDSALEMADPSTSLHVIHVVVPIPAFVPFDVTVPIPPTEDSAGEYERCKERLEEHFGKGEYKRFKQHCTIGDPATEIIKLSSSVRADLIVMPSHGRTGISRLLLGSVAEHVLRKANCAVLILRGDAS